MSAEHVDAIVSDGRRERRPGVQAEIPGDVLRDTIVQFPTFSEAIGTAVGRLEL